MKHFADASFWSCYHKLPFALQRLADKAFRLLKQDLNHQSLHLKRVNQFLSVRVGMSCRALGVSSNDGNLVWFWIGTHREYERLIK